MQKLGFFTIPEPQYIQLCIAFMLVLSAPSVIHHDPGTALVTKNKKKNKKENRCDFVDFIVFTHGVLHIRNQSAIPLRM